MINIAPRPLLIAMLAQVQYVKLNEEFIYFREFLEKKFKGMLLFIDSHDHWGCSTFDSGLICNCPPLIMTKENPGASGYAVHVHPDSLSDRVEEIPLHLEVALLAQNKETKHFFAKELPLAIREYYQKNVPDGEVRLWRSERKNTTEQNNKFGA